MYNFYIPVLWLQIWIYQKGKIFNYKNYQDLLFIFKINNTDYPGLNLNAFGHFLSTVVSFIFCSINDEQQASKEVE